MKDVSAMAGDWEHYFCLSPCRKFNRLWLLKSLQRQIFTIELLQLSNSTVSIKKIKNICQWFRHIAISISVAS